MPSLWKKITGRTAKPLSEFFRRTRRANRTAHRNPLNASRANRSAPRSANRTPQLSAINNPLNASRANRTPQRNPLNANRTANRTAQLSAINNPLNANRTPQLSAINNPLNASRANRTAQLSAINNPLNANRTASLEKGPSRLKQRLELKVPPKRLTPKYLTKLIPRNMPNRNPINSEGYKNYKLRLEQLKSNLRKLPPIHILPPPPKLTFVPESKKIIEEYIAPLISNAVEMNKELNLTMDTFMKDKDTSLKKSFIHILDKKLLSYIINRVKWNNKFFKHITEMFPDEYYGLLVYSNNKDDTYLYDYIDGKNKIVSDMRDTIIMIIIIRIFCIMVDSNMSRAPLQSFVRPGEFIIDLAIDGVPLKFNINRKSDSISIPYNYDNRNSMYRNSMYHHIYDVRDFVNLLYDLYNKMYKRYALGNLNTKNINMPTDQAIPKNPRQYNLSNVMKSELKSHDVELYNQPNTHNNGFITHLVNSPKPTNGLPIDLKYKQEYGPVYLNKLFLKDPQLAIELLIKLEGKEFDTEMSNLAIEYMEYIPDIREDIMKAKMKAKQRHSIFSISTESKRLAENYADVIKYIKQKMLSSSARMAAERVYKGTRPNGTRVFHQQTKTVLNLLKGYAGQNLS
jgi:hypothetical protein